MTSANSVEESTDGGSTWREIARIVQGHWFGVHKVKKLRSGGEGEPWIHECRVCHLEEHCT